MDLGILVSDEVIVGVVIERIKQNLNPALNIRGILLTMYDKRNKLSAQVEEEARKHFVEKVYHDLLKIYVKFLGLLYEK